MITNFKSNSKPQAPSPKLSVLFRCDGSPEIGLGHIVRCIALADELYNIHNSRISFAIRTGPLGIQIVEEKGYQAITPRDTGKTFDYGKWLSGCIEDTEADVLIFDVRDNLDKTIVKRLKEEHKLLIVDIDDPEEKRLSADLAFYPPVPQVKKMDWSGFKGDLYSGWEYAILRKEFHKEYPRPQNKNPNILVTMGGSDPMNMTKFVIQSLDRIEERFTVTIILGSGYQHTEGLNELLKNIKFKYSIFQNPSNIADIMANADFAIASFGVTAYELALLGVPTIYLCLSEDHEESSSIFVTNKLGVSVGVFLNIRSSLIRNAIINFLNQVYLRKFNNKKVILPSVNNMCNVIDKSLRNTDGY